MHVCVLYDVLKEHKAGKKMVYFFHKDYRRPPKNLLKPSIHEKNNNHSGSTYKLTLQY